MHNNKRQRQADIGGVGQRPRRRNLNDFNSVKPVTSLKQSKPVNLVPKTRRKVAPRNAPTEVISEQDVIDSTRSDVDESKIGKKSWWARRKAKKQARKQKWARRKLPIRIGYRLFKTGATLAVVYGIYLFVITFTSINSVIDRGNGGALALQENIQPSALKGEGDGRINIMLLGIGGDGHKAGDLADSIIVASIDPFAKEAAMLSVPRDMYVDIPGYHSARVNAAHALGEDNPDQPGGGIALMRDTLEETLDISIHYYLRIDFQGFVSAIDTIGGITINLDEAVYDPNFDWEFGSNALNLPAGENTLDGQTALLLSRARGASGIGLGISRGDFGRGDRQRDILLAAKDKVLSAGTYANPVRLGELIRTAGNHVRTDIQISEMLRLYEIIDSISPDKIISFGLDNGADNYLQSANIDGASVLQPKSGTYQDIQLFVRELFVDGFIRQEEPLLDVYNGSVVAGLAGETSAELETYGYNIGHVANAPTQNYQITVIYDLSGGEKPFTKQLITTRFGVEVTSGDSLPDALKDTTSDFVIILGTDNAQEEASF